MERERVCRFPVSQKHQHKMIHRRTIKWLSLSKTTLGLLILLTFCSNRVSSMNLYKLRGRDDNYNVMDTSQIQGDGSSLSENTRKISAKVVNAVSDAIHCTPGHTLPFVFSKRKYFLCSAAGVYKLTDCPTDTTFNSETGQYSNVKSSDIFSKILRFKSRSKRAVGDADPTDENEPKADIPSVDNTNTNANNTEDVEIPNEETPEGLENDDSISPAPVAVEVEESTVKEEEETTATTTTTTTTPEPPTTVKATTMAEVVIPEKSSAPPYVIITEQPPVQPETTTANATGAPASSARTGAVIGILVAILVIIIIIIVIIVLVKKGKINLHSAKMPVKRKKIVTKMENPQYGNAPGHTYRFSKDSSLQVGPTSSGLTKFNNPNLADTPVPKVLQSSDSPASKRQNSLPRSIASRREKRRAPAPPNPFGEYDYNDDQGDLYEKASQGSMEPVELQTFAVKNENTNEADDNDNEPSYPLLKRNPSTKKTDSLENGKVKSDTKSARKSPEKKSPQKESGPEKSEAEEELLKKDKEESKSKTSLDQLSVDFTLDEYDMTNNPFFAKTT